MMRLALTGIALCFYAVIALAGGFGVGNDLTGFWQKPTDVPASISLVGCTLNHSNITSYTFTNHATGTAGNRWTIVGVTMSDNATAFTIDSMTIGGNSATEIKDNSADTGSFAQTAIYIQSNPSGTTADIVVTASEAVIAAVVCVWAAYDLQSATAHATASQFQTSSANIVLSLNVPASGIGVGICNTMGLTDTATWAGFTENAPEKTPDNHSASSAHTTTVGTPLTVGCDWTGTSDATGTSASFR